MGDEVQAIKAGVMEIADLFVVNKADRPGVEQTVREIEAYTDRPVFKTVASTGEGTGAVVEWLAGRKPGGRLESLPHHVIDHLGIAVRSIDEALPFYEAQLGMPAAARETVEHEGVRVAMIGVGDSRIELLEPLNEDSVIAKFLARRGPGLHHVALRVSDFPATVERLRAAGVRLLSEPRTGAGGHTYVFVHPNSTGGVLWELIQCHP
jgi:LAO/AO transport system kinase